MPGTEGNQTEHDCREAEEAANPAGDRDVDPKLLEILVCPLTKTPLRYDRRARELISDQAGLAFPIRNGVPIMLVDEARVLDDDPASPGIAAMAERNRGSVPK
jgi:uncharacterized protein YbaR (Trm112 family)